MVDYLVHIDYVDHFAWVVLDADNLQRGLATARFVRLTQPEIAEMAFGTVDRYQGRGIGTFLLGAIGVAAEQAGVTTLVAHVLEDNRPMRAVFAKVPELGAGESYQVAQRVGRVDHQVGLARQEHGAGIQRNGVRAGTVDTE